uniref:Uncharacterized protein n=1 Tax=Wuchereria bancrofti TaxID=6293 RepID=A0A1I8EX50_WUCBA
MFGSVTMTHKAFWYIHASLTMDEEHDMTCLIWMDALLIQLFNLMCNMKIWKEQWWKRGVISSVILQF